MIAPAVEPRPPRDPVVATRIPVGTMLGSALVPVVAVGLGGQNDVTRVLAIAGVAGVFFGPVAGHWYAGDYWTRGLALRFGGVALGALGGLAAIGYALSTDCGDRSCAGNGGALVLAALGLIGGGSLAIAGIIIDIESADDVARAYNRRAGWTITPAPVQSGDGVAPGLVVSGAF